MLILTSRNRISIKWEFIHDRGMDYRILIPKFALFLVENLLPLWFRLARVRICRKASPFILLLFLLGAFQGVIGYCSNTQTTRWLEIKSTHLVIRYTQNDHVLAGYMIERGEADYRRIVKDIGSDPGIAVDVYLAPDKDTYSALQPRGHRTHDWSIGTFHPSENLILILSPKAQKEGRSDLHETFAHELTHFILHAITIKTGVELPTWLHEGLAMYEARQWNWHYRAIMTQISLSRSFLPLSSLTKGFPDDKRLAEKAYAQSISLMAYIINKYSPKHLHDIIRNLTEGHSTQEAFQRALGISLGDFEKKWHAHVRRHYTWIPILTSGFTLWFLISLLALGIYLHKKRTGRQKMAVWDIEDQIDSLF